MIQWKVISILLLFKITLEYYYLIKILFWFLYYINNLIPVYLGSSNTYHHCATGTSNKEDEKSFPVSFNSESSAARDKVKTFVEKEHQVVVGSRFNATTIKGKNPLIIAYAQSAIEEYIAKPNIQEPNSGNLNEGCKFL